MLGVRQFPIPSSMPWRLLNLGETYTRELDAAVTAFRWAALLLDVQISELATRGFDDPDFVGASIVSSRCFESVIDDRKPRRQFLAPL